MRMQARAAIPERAKEARTRGRVTVTDEVIMRVTRCGVHRTAPGFLRRIVPHPSRGAHGHPPTTAAPRMTACLPSPDVTERPWTSP